MPEFRRVAFLTEHFSLLSPAQQVLDRFLIGYTDGGAFVRPQVRVSAWCSDSTAKPRLEKRRQDFALEIADTPEKAMEGADALVLAGTPANVAPDPALIRRTLLTAAPGTRVFVYGLLAETGATASELVEISKSRSLRLAAGTVLPTTFRLPELELPKQPRLKDALIIVQGPFPSAEVDALEGLLPILEKRRKGEAGIVHVQRLQATDLWTLTPPEPWFWPLLQAAASRTHTPQGNPVLDGRTEDLVGLGLLPKLAPQARAWSLQHRDGLRSLLLVLTGAMTDINFAVRLSNGSILSAQLFRAPPPAQEHYSRFAAALSAYFVSGSSIWPLARTILEADLVASMRASSVTP